MQRSGRTLESESRLVEQVKFNVITMANRQRFIALALQAFAVDNQSKLIKIP
ncbi:hypothetical protein FHW67_004025 [Herbaspirillum sp. Sphag1AN]|nr:hypothetical protein [Herbaspirillum sp. Sphag1AN]MBB3247894.1 hypothetical protein [Herbaspirillum sp. Sphag64]